MSVSRARAHVASDSAGSWLGLLGHGWLCWVMAGWKDTEKQRWWAILRSVRSVQLSLSAVEEHPDTGAIKAPWWTLRPLMAAPR